MLSELEQLNVDLEKADFFITHLHADHLGLLTTIASDTSAIYFNHREASMINSGIRVGKILEGQLRVLHFEWLPEMNLRNLLKAILVTIKNKRGLLLYFERRRYHKDRRLLIKCIETPGHSPGHMVFYEPDKKILISGDHILFDITPNITSWLGIKNSLGDYLTSLEKSICFDVTLVLPGHRAISNNQKKRIEELLKHHQTRMDEILLALRDGGKLLLISSLCHLECRLRLVGTISSSTRNGSQSAKQLLIWIFSKKNRRFGEL